MGTYTRSACAGLWDSGTTHGKEEVADVVGRVDGQANVGEVEAVAEPDERHAEDVVHDELLEVLAAGLHAQHEHDGLLGPEGGLEEVVELDQALVRAVRKALVHAARVEVPHGRAAHDVHADKAQGARVQGHVDLLHEAGLLAARAHAAVPRQRLQHLLHDQLARKRQHDGVEGHEGEVPGALAVVHRRARAGGRQGVREEDEVVNRVRRARVQRVEGQEDGEQDERERPGVFADEAAAAVDEGAGLAPAGRSLGGRWAGAVLGGAVEMRQTSRQSRGACVADAHLDREPTGFPSPAGAAIIGLDRVQCVGRRRVQQGKGLGSRHGCCMRCVG